MANLMTRFEPFSELARFAPLRGIDDLWRDLRDRYELADGNGQAMRLDVSETDDAYTVKADLPGVKKEDIKVDVDGNRVSISAEVRRETDEKKDGKIVRSERYVGQQYRSFTLEHAIDDSRADAKYDSGVLSLTLPKKPAATTRKIQIS